MTIELAPQMMINVNIDRDDHDEYARLGRRWLTEVPRLFAPDIWQRMLDGDPDIDSSMVIVPRPDGPIRAVDFDYVRLEKDIEKLSHPAEGISYGSRTDESKDLDVEVSWKKRGHARLWCGFPVTKDSLPDTSGMVIGFLGDLLDGADPAYASASLNSGDYDKTVLDKVLRRAWRDSVDEARIYLRGYSWLTVIPKELVAKLGGVDVLHEASFAVVHSLSSGGAIVAASSTPLEYDEAAMRRLFRTLAPILPPGKPKSRYAQSELQIVYEDAASVT